MKLEQIVMYCDGSCLGNGKDGANGGWAATFVDEKNVKTTISGNARNTTNNRMELTAVIKGLEELENSTKVKIYTDSAYVVNAFEQKWIEKWQQNGWVNSKKRPVENKDLWLKLIDLTKQHTVLFYKVKGHNGNELNELCDATARKRALELNFDEV